MPRATDHRITFLAAVLRQAAQPKVQALARAIAAGDRVAIEAEADLGRVFGLAGTK